MRHEGLGARLKELRESSGISRKVLSERTGITPSRIGYIERKDSVRDAELSALLEIFPDLGSLVFENALEQRTEPEPAPNPQATALREMVEADPEGYEATKDLKMTVEFVVDTSLFPDWLALIELSKTQTESWEWTDAEVEELDETGVPYRPIDDTLELLWENAVVDPPVTDSDLRLYSHSEFKTFKRCRRKWWLQYHEGWKPKVDPGGALAIGTRYHRALEGWYVPEGQTRVHPADTLERVIVEDWTKLSNYWNENGAGNGVPESTALAFKKDADLSRAMVSGYIEWLEQTGADQGLQIVGSETVVSVPSSAFLPARSRGAWALAGTLDAIAVRESDGARMFLDHKTAQSFEQHLRTLHLDEQMLTYMLISSAQRGRVDVAMYNMARKVKRTGAAKPPFFTRHEVRHNESEIESYAARVAGTVSDIETTTQWLQRGHPHREVVYPTPTQDCSWSCPFFNVCPMFDDGSRVNAALEHAFTRADPTERYRGAEPE